jgi:hypothetical protein
MDAHVSILQDVQIEHVQDNVMTVLSDVPGIRGEELTLRIGPSDTMTVRTTSSEPRLLDGRLVHRVHLALSGVLSMANPERTIPPRGPADPTTIMFIRRHTARIVNLSRGGCLFELSTRLPVGTVATLQHHDAPLIPDPVRVNSLHERKGGSWPYAAGAEFLSLEPPSSHSLRAIAGRMEVEEGGFAT